MTDSLIFFDGDESVDELVYAATMKPWTVQTSHALHRCFSPFIPNDKHAKVKEQARRIFAFAHWFDSLVDDPSDFEIGYVNSHRILNLVGGKKQLLKSWTDATSPEVLSCAILLSNSLQESPGVLRKVVKSAQAIVEISVLKRNVQDFDSYVRLLSIEAGESAVYFLAAFSMNANGGLKYRLTEHYCRRLLLAAIYKDAADDLRDDYSAGLLSIAPKPRYRATLYLRSLLIWVTVTCQHPLTARNFYKGSVFSRILIPGTLQ